MDAGLIALVAGLAALTYLARALPFFASAKFAQLPDKWLSMLDRLGVFLIAAILAVAVVPDRASVTAAPHILPTVAGLFVVVGVYHRTGNIGLTLAAALPAFFAVRLMVSSFPTLF
jgi:branched-subunit amino acid transport protein